MCPCVLCLCVWVFVSDGWVCVCGVCMFWGCVYGGFEFSVCVGCLWVLVFVWGCVLGGCVCCACVCGV